MRPRPALGHPSVGRARALFQDRALPPAGLRRWMRRCLQPRGRSSAARAEAGAGSAAGAPLIPEPGELGEGRRRPCHPKRFEARLVEPGLAMIGWVLLAAAVA